MINVQAIGAYQDNYIWLITFDDNQTIIVDPGDARPVLNTLSNERLNAAAIFVTHSHWDHIDGIDGIIKRTPLPVYGKPGAIPHLSHPVGEGDTIRIGSTEFRVFSVPGHTADHVAYYGHGALFCGDTLFAAGCGRVGTTSQQLFESLKKLAALPINTLVYCTHEYTLDNLRFAQAVEPDNGQIQARMAHCLELRGQGRPTLPSTLEEEFATNPFLRCAQPQVIAAAAARAGKPLADEAAVFATLRAWKNVFS